MHEERNEALGFSDARVRYEFNLLMGRERVRRLLKISRIVVAAGAAVAVLSGLVAAWAQKRAGELDMPPGVGTTTPTLSGSGSLGSDSRPPHEPPPS